MKCGVITYKQAGANSIKFLLLQLVTLVISSCATMPKGHHTYLMKKGDAEVSSDEVYLCIGARGGATAEQELNAHKIAKMSKAQRDPSPGFAREYTGKVKVTEILDEQFARVVSISEKVKMDSIVEPTKP